jgi:hypothetical protein
MREGPMLHFSMEGVQLGLVLLSLLLYSALILSSMLACWKVLYVFWI